MKLTLIPRNTKMQANGNGDSFDVSRSSTRTFLCVLIVTDQLEQESLDVSIYGSVDGATWTSKPLLKLPQQFYRGHAKWFWTCRSAPTSNSSALVGSSTAGEGALRWRCLWLGWS